MTNGDTAPVRCAQPACTFGTPGGRCANGFEDPIAGRCPDYFSDITARHHEAATTLEMPEDDFIGAEAAPAAPESLSVNIHPAAELGFEAAGVITAARASRVIVVAGLARSGKTTLLTSLYERFHDGAVLGYRYAGSRTLIAFEQWCHESRVRSGRDSADTARTPHTASGEGRFLHLRVRPNETREAPGNPVLRDLLLTDLHGEAFRRVRDNSAAAAEMRVLPRAEHFVQLVDGAKLVDQAERHGAVQDALAVLQSCIAAGVIGEGTIVHIVGTKWDLVRASECRSGIEAYWQQKTRAFESLLAGKIGRLHIRTIAARALPDATLDEWGIGSLLSSWIEESLLAPPTPSVRGDVSAAGEFDRFEVRCTDE